MNAQGKDLLENIDGVMWAYRTLCILPIRTSPYHMVFEKTCHQAYWAIMKLNFYQNLHVGSEWINYINMRSLGSINANFYKEKM